MNEKYLQSVYCVGSFIPSSRNRGKQEASAYAKIITQVIFLKYLTYLRLTWQNYLEIDPNGISYAICILLFFCFDLSEFHKDQSTGFHVSEDRKVTQIFRRIL